MGLWRGFCVYCSFSLATGPTEDKTRAHTHGLNMQTNHARTLSLSTHVQTDPFNLLTYWSICSLFIYLFIHWWDLSLTLVFVSYVCTPFSSYPHLERKNRKWPHKKKKKNRLHLARSPSTTALYTVSLKRECKYVAWSQLTSELACVCVHVTVIVCLCVHFFFFKVHKLRW